MLVLNAQQVADGSRRRRFLPETVIHRLTLVAIVLGFVIGIVFSFDLTQLGTAAWISTRPMVTMAGAFVWRALFSVGWLHGNVRRCAGKRTQRRRCAGQP